MQCISGRVSQKGSISIEYAAVVGVKSSKAVLSGRCTPHTSGGHEVTKTSAEKAVAEAMADKKLMKIIEGLNYVLF